MSLEEKVLVHWAAKNHLAQTDTVAAGSYATFLLHSIFSNLESTNKANAHAIIFNVKGEDLMFMDKNKLKITIWQLL